MGEFIFLNRHHIKQTINILYSWVYPWLFTNIILFLCSHDTFHRICIVENDSGINYTIFST